ncbi:LuxR family transcriptional regulator [Streptomyces ficellus]|uniref:LuxR family transcriptional regulator n=1 Tax=Streptomyces ficellus TaxID=1977088 RepID=A0ABT7Z1K2_9ACTN|nr:LuxR family transcriptional regulator [Streptomyces ficellus]MDN3293360.1 LuxR family transcriptional regulator [Streptomyces ficellus]
MPTKTTARSPLRLFGRDAELDAVAALFGRLLSGRSGVLLLAGEPGLGRTALLDRAARDFDAGPVLHTRAAPAERHLAHSGVHALLSTAPGPTGTLCATLLRTGLPPTGLLDLLRRTSTHRPLLVCVDDAHLWDPPSRAALGFAARRVDSVPAIGLLLSVAGHRADAPDFAGLPLVRLGPLTEQAAGALLDELTGAAADPLVREELLYEAEGNPALLTALVDRLSGPQLSGHAPLPRPLADGPALMRVVGGRLAELPPATRELLLLVAAAHEQHGDGSGADAALVLRAARAAGLDPAALDAAEAAGVVRDAGNRIRFDDPLMRRAVHRGAPLSRRRAAHTLLAAALDGERHRLAHLSHRALACDGPDTRLAAELAAAAAAPDVRAEPLQRSLAFARAADLTATDGARAARLTAAAEYARLGGRPRRARELLAAAREGAAAHDAVRGSTELVRGTLALRDGPVGDAHEALLLAAALLDPYDPGGAWTARFGALEAAWAAGDVPACLAALGQGVSPAAPAPGHDDFRAGMLAALGGRFGEASGPLRRVLARAGHDDDPAGLLRAGVAALVLGDIAAACHVNARALAAARARDIATLVPQALEHLAYAELRAGRHARARAHAEEGLRAAHHAGQRNVVAHHHAALALVASIEGDGAALTAHTDAALAVAGPHGLAQAAGLAEWARARADLSRGLALDAAARLGPLVRPGHRRGHFAVRMLMAPCFVEATVLAGEPGDDTRTAVEEFALWAALGADPQAPAQLARCRALLAPPGEAEALYAYALTRHEHAGGDFERARTLLLYGKWLRRRRRPREARGRLTDALYAFERSGARVWADQTGAELRATGGTATREAAGPLACLTPQQLRIARCVAEGATNREVALRLSISPRTVDHHLRNVFALLGVRSRVELSRLVAREERNIAAG